MTDTQPAHSKLGASSMYRWAACPGSVRLSQGVQDYKSKYAEDGSDAHALAAHCLTTGFDPCEFLNGNPHTIDGRTFTVDKEMVEAVEQYVDYIRDTREEGDVDMVEVRFDLSRVYPGCFGTSDHVRWRARTRTLFVRDYKHGEGTPVEVYKNPQGLYYSLGALIAGGYPAEKVIIEIVQPRCAHQDGPIRAYEIDAVELLDFRTDLVAYAKATEALDAPLVSGDHCKFCPASRVRKCPRIEEDKEQAIRAAFAPGLPYDPAALAKALDSRPAVKAWLKNLDEFAYAEAESGRFVDHGYKIVPKRATRKWKEEGPVIERCQEKGFTPDDYFDRSLKSPAQLEKVVGKKVLDDLIVSESSGHVLVPDSDKRPAVERVPVKDAFTTIAN